HDQKDVRPRQYSSYGIKNKKHTILSQKLSNLRMWGFLDVKKFNLGKYLLRFYSIEAFFERNKKNPL
ncbi:hypothetical protein B4Q05_19515, partial [Acinetobacter baumannii]